MLRYLLFIFFTLFIATHTYTQAQAQNLKTIRKNLQDKEFEKAKEKINKLIEQDTFQLAALFLNTQYFLDSANRKMNIDSAYLQTNVLIYRHKSLNITNKRQEAAQEELADLQILATDFEEQKHTIETNIFYFTLRKDNTVTGWQLFMQKYPTSKLVEQAVIYRNELAFGLAKRENTVQSYKIFIDKYPQAEQINEAKIQYENLLYKFETKDGSLASYNKFLNTYPTTKFRNEIETKIFELFIGDFSIDVYKDFLRQYPNSHKTATAWAWIWHLTTDKNNFLKQYPNFPAKDFANKYVKFLNIPLYSVLENHKISMIDNQGNVLVNTPFEQIGEEDRCKVVEKDMIVGGSGEKAGAADRLGNLVVPFDYDYLEYVGKGVFIAEKDKKQGAYFSGLPINSQDFPKVEGNLVIPCEYDELEAVAENQFIKFKKNNKYGLFCYNGIKFLEAEYDKIEKFRGDTLLIVKGKDKGFFSPEKLLNIFHESQLKSQGSNQAKSKMANISLKLPFENYELSHKVFIKLKYGESFGIVDLDGNELIKADKKLLKEIASGWLVQEHENNWQLFNFKGESFSDIYEKIIPQQITENYVTRIYGFTVQKNLKFGAADNQGKVFVNTEYDKIEWIGENILLGTQGKKTFWITPTNTKVEILNRKDLIFKQLVKSGTHIFIITQNIKLKKQGIYNSEGKLIVQFKYDNLQQTENNLFIFTQAKTKGLINLESKILLQPKYQQIIFTAPFSYSLQNNKKKFGLYHSRKKFLYEPNSVDLLTAYGDSSSAMIAQKGKLLLLNDLKNKPLTPEQFVKVEFWTDSVVLVKTQQNLWKLYDIVGKKFLGEKFDDYKILTKSSKEKVIITYRGKGFGLLSNRRGNLIPEDYSFFKNLGTVDNQFFFVEVYVSQAELHVVLYMDKDGNVVRKQTIPHSEYDKVMCEE
jgi:hypothetical protein